MALLLKRVPKPSMLSSFRPILSSVQHFLPSSASVRPSLLLSTNGGRSFSNSSVRNLNRESSTRYTSGSWAKGDNIEYDELKKITDNPDDTVLVIDVREPDEVALGSIPSSVNLPLSSFEKSLSMDEGDFTRIHGFHKPAKGQNIIFYCRSGKRAQTAIDLAKRSGYRSMRNYEGSYLDWAAKDAKNDD